jgi:hypothetical protein
MSNSRGLLKQKSYAFGMKKREPKGPSATMSILDALQVIKEKLIYDSRSAWVNAEILYHISITKRQFNSEATAEVNQNTSQSKKANMKLRFLIILKKNESSAFHSTNNGIYYLLQIGVKDNGLFNRVVDVKNTWDIRKIRGVDIGGIDNDFVLSVDKGDVNYTFANNLERDETLWVIIQLCKLVANSNTDIIDSFSVGYSVDVEAISYTIVTNGTLNRFPTIFKLFQSSGLLNADAFGEEEIEAESLLEELKWASGHGTAEELQQNLSEQSNYLNTQIIDYLLQWEELDDSSRQSLSAPPSSKANLRNTVEILDALNKVDDELEESSLWLAIQIDRLSETKSHLVFIEDESGGLESSLHNLQAIRDVINAVVKHLTLEKESESLLHNPEPAMTMTLKAATLKNTDELLRPLISAATQLANALAYKGEDNLIPPQVWKQIRSIKAVVEQKNKLYRIAEEFSGVMTESLCNIFPAVLKHKSLNDDAKNQNIDIKNFKTSAVILHRKRQRRKVADQTLSRSSLSQELPLTDEDVHALYYVPTDLNLLLHCQRIYHKALSDYIPLAEKLFMINPSSTALICRAYIESANDKFYASLFKSMMREFRTLMPSSRLPVTLASIPRYQYKGMREVAVRFSTRESLVNENQTQLLPPWELFAIFLLIATPVVLREEVFFQSLFNIDLNVNETQARDWLSVFTDSNISTIPMLTETNGHMATIFQSLVHLVHKLSAYSSSDIVTRASTVNTGTSVQASTPVDADVDIVETVGLLTVLYQFVYHYLDRDSSTTDASANATETRVADFEVTSSLVMLMYEIRGIFLTRLHAFEVEQIKWIQASKWDIKRAGVSAPFSKFTSLAYQVLEMVCGQMIDHIDKMMGVLAKELLTWLSVIAQQNPKHADVFRLQNLIFLEESLADVLQYFPALKSIIDDSVILQRQDAESRYVSWMISYELGGLGAFANKIEKLGSNIRDEELVLYITNKEVLAIMKEYDSIKKFETAILNIRKRLKKHCESSEDQVCPRAFLSSITISI